MQNKIDKPILKSLKPYYFNQSEKFSFVLFFKQHENINSKGQEEKETKQKKKKSTWVFLLFNFIIVGAIIAYTFITQETKPISELIKEMPYYRYLFVGFLMMMLFYTIRGVSYAIMIKQTTGKFRLWLGIRTAIIGKYWDSITPGGSGGQFAQVGYMRGKGCSGEVSTSVIVGNYMLWQIGFMIMGVLVIVMPFSLYSAGKIIKYFALAGVIGNVLLFIFLLIVSINRKLCSICIVGGLKLLKKIKIIKNYRKALYKSLKFVREYQHSIRMVAKNPLTIMLQIMLSVVSIICVASVDYFIYRTFNPFGGVSPIQIIAMSILCVFATTLFIVPGGSGAAEISYVAMFSALFTEGTTFWALIFWRLLTYYLYIIVGFLLTVIEPFCYNRNKIRRGKVKVNIKK